jgi:hypothetical protein
MSKYKSERSLSPVNYQTASVEYKHMGSSYGETGIICRNKKTGDEALAKWEEIKRVTIVRNSHTLGIVHFILVIIFLRGIISAIFFPHLIFHLFNKWTIKWAGFIEVEQKDGQIFWLTPAGWTRLGFHISEANTIYTNMGSYTKLPDLEIIDHKDYQSGREA